MDEIVKGMNEYPYKKSVEEIYDKEITFENIKENPLLQPISEIKQTYNSESHMVLKATIEFDETRKRINEMVKLNPVYSECIIVSEMKDLIRLAETIIHAQDLQRGMIKQALNKMIELNNSYFILKQEDKGDFPMEEIKNIASEGKRRGRPKKIEEVPNG